MRTSPKVRIRTRQRGGRAEWIAVWHADGKDHSLTMDRERVGSMREAENVAAEIEDDLAQGKDPRSKSILLPAMIEKYLEWIGARYRPSTFQIHADTLKRYFAWLGERHPQARTPRHLRPKHFEEYQTWRKGCDVMRIATGGKHKPTGQKVSNRTVNIEIGVLHSLCQWAAGEDRRYISSNPVKKVKKLSEPQPNTHFLEHGQDAILETQLAKSKRKGFEYALAFRVMIETGLRPSELFKGLRRVDVDWNQGRIKATRSEFHTPKTGNERAVPVSPETLARLRGLAAQHDHPQLFTATVKGFQQAMWKAQKDTGIRAYPYALRHTYGTRLLAVSNLRLVQVAMGHKQIATTARYMHIVQDDIDEAATAMWTRDKLRTTQKDAAASTRNYKRKK